MRIAVDMGGSKVLAGLVSENGTLLQNSVIREKAQYGSDGEAFIAQYERLARMLLNTCEEQVTGLGITLPGISDAEKGTLRYAPFSGLQGLEVASELSHRLNIPVWGDNDVNACARAERRWGSASAKNQNCSDFVWMTVSSGIGGALWLNDKIRYGADGCCGEFGHMVVCEGENGFVCGCGQVGCLEAMAAGPAWTRHWLALGGMEPLDAAAIAGLAREGNEKACMVIDIVAEYIGRGLAWIVNVVNPERIYLGGGVMGAADLLLPKISDVMGKRAMVNRYRVTQVQVTGLGYEAGLLGAAALVP